MSKPFDLLKLLEDFAVREGLDLDDPRLPERFMVAAAGGVHRAVKDPVLLHGKRAEALFEALVVSLGRQRLVKAEDTGKVHGGDGLRSPDFRIVLADGEQWLVEVKNVHITNPGRQKTRLSAAYVSSLRAYGELVGSPVKIALYWSAWGIWTLISPEAFLAADGSITVEMGEALFASELGRLGDVMVATTPPLRVVFRADPDRPCRFHHDGMAEFTIGGVAVFSEDREINDPALCELIWVMMDYGEWPLEGPSAVKSGEQLVGVEFVSSPRERTNPHQNFEIIGSFSRMFSQYQAARTMKDGNVVRLTAEPVTGWRRALDPKTAAKAGLPLWVFAQQPQGGSRPPFASKSMPRQGTTFPEHEPAAD